jgi:hypothetical protein
MSDKGMGFGGFLLGLGGGWYFFNYINVSLNILSYILILLGASIIINALFSRGGRRNPIQGLTGGVIGGLFLALFLTQGFTVFESIGEGFGTVGSNYRVQETETLTGDVDLQKLLLEIDNKNGEITVETWDQTGYQIDLTMKAKGATDAQAQTNLDQIQVRFSDDAVADTQRVSLEFQVPGDNWSNYAISVSAKVPDGVTLDLDIATSNGEIALADVSGRDIVLHTSNGRMTLDKVYAETIRGSTSNGMISGEVEATVTDLSTSNGSIDLTIPATRSGDYKLDTSNGGIDITLPKSTTIGYDINLSTSIGSASVNLPNMSYTTNESRRKVASTEGYMDKEIQVKITAKTSIGSIEIN